MAEMTVEQAFEHLLFCIARYIQDFDDYKTANDALATLRAEIEQLEKNAGRYQWLRDAGIKGAWCVSKASERGGVHQYDAGSLDAAIDASKGASHEP